MGYKNWRNLESLYSITTEFGSSQKKLPLNNKLRVFRSKI